MSKKKVVIGLSGGVDSSVAALLLKEEGYEVCGVTMETYKDDPRVEAPAKDAKIVADYLGIQHEVVDFCSVFKEKVIDYFIKEYQDGHTPNPCIVCNKYVKWEALLEYADKIGADYIATGHYARIIQLENGRYTLTKAAFDTKDQTYALNNLTQEQLSRTMMPVGEYSKEEIRKKALEAGIPVAMKPDSQEICFIPDDDYAGFILDHSGKEILPGAYVDKTGKVIGTHKGIIHYTIGQRKGLNLSMGHPVFVTAIRPEENQVVIGESEDLFVREVYAKDINYMAVSEITEPMKAFAKIRYNHKGDSCTVEITKDGLMKCTFDVPVRAVTPGQSLVVYQNEHMIASGTII